MRSSHPGKYPIALFDFADAYGGCGEVYDRCAGRSVKMLEKLMEYGPREASD